MIPQYSWWISCLALWDFIEIFKIWVFWFNSRLNTHFSTSTAYLNRHTLLSSWVFNHKIDLKSLKDGSFQSLHPIFRLVKQNISTWSNKEIPKSLEISIPLSNRISCHFNFKSLNYISPQKKTQKMIKY